jgi:asparagine synthase (glutamine-hydrolysing)
LFDKLFKETFTELINMCGIWVYVDKNTKLTNEELYNHFMRTSHRGPDHSSFQKFGDDVFIGFHRLAIMDPSPLSNQPFVIDMGNGEVAVFICNGEIYNYRELNDKYNLGLSRHADCMVIPLLYRACGMDYKRFIDFFIEEIKGEYAFVMTFFNSMNNRVSHVIAGRDHIGVRPLYYGCYKDTILFSSEIKSCEFFNGTVKEFHPGTIQRVCYEDDLIMSYIDVQHIEWCSSVLSTYKTQEQYLEDVRNALNNSVMRRLNSDAPIGFLLSGGVDSSLICSIACNIIGSGRNVRTFCCGMEGGSDLIYARRVAEFLGTDHTEVIFTEEEALTVINDVIHTVETWDTTTIRASVGQYLISKFIRENTDIKVLMVGEGPDEVCSSYLFNWYAPSPERLHYAAVEYVKDIHKFDVKRVDRCVSAFGIEARVPYLDPEFIRAYWEIPPKERVPNAYRIEKWWLRKSFDSEDGPPILPPDVLWRRKEAFSDGISSTSRSWFQTIRRYIVETFNMTEEEYYIHTFVELFGKKRLNIIDKYWQPKWNRDGEDITDYVDPSARTLGIYDNNI